MTENRPESQPEVEQVLSVLVTHLTKLEAACRAVAAELAGLWLDLADTSRGMPPRRRRPPEPPDVPVRRLR